MQVKIVIILRYHFLKASFKSSWKFKATVHVHHTMFSNIPNIRYLFLLICITPAKKNKTVANSGCTNVCFTRNDLSIMLLCIFGVFIISTSTWLLSRIQWIRWTIDTIDVLLKFYCLKKFCKMRALFQNFRGSVLSVLSVLLTTE